MQAFHRSYLLNVVSLFTMIVICAVTAVSTAVADGYGDALKGVKGIKAVFDYSQGDPKMSNIIMGAVKDMIEDEAAASLPEKTRLVILFQGPAVKLITTDCSNFPEKQFGELDAFHGMIRELKSQGVKFEVCLYAAQVVGVDPSTILPEIDQVGNGFIATTGYQAQGYALVRVP